jgi:hypothetical protein
MCQRHETYVHMPVMRGIERPSQQADPPVSCACNAAFSPAAGFGGQRRRPAGDEEAVKSESQGRTWPLPRTKYL